MDEARVASGDEFDIVRAFSDEPPDTTNTGTERAVGFPRFLDELDPVGAASDAELVLKDVRYMSERGLLDQRNDLVRREFPAADVFARAGALDLTPDAIVRLLLHGVPRTGSEWLDARANAEDLVARVLHRRRQEQELRKGDGRGPSRARST